MERPPDRLPHLLVHDTATTHPYTNPSAGRGGRRAPSRDRVSHGRHVQQSYEAAVREAKAAWEQAAVPGLPKDGIFLAFHGQPDCELELKRLEARRPGIELVAVRQVEDVVAATVFIPDGKVGYFLKKIEDYLDPDKETKKGKPRNQPLVDAISDVRRATLEAFWTEPAEPFPTAEERFWWEIWLRGSDETKTVDPFGAYARQKQFWVSERSLRFPDRHVVLAIATPAQLADSVDVLDTIAELRRAKVTARDFLDLETWDQAEWADELRRRTTPAAPGAPAVCVLDTGVKRAHRLLSTALPREAWLAYERAWRPDDHHGHGTEMAGIALFGDLRAALSSSGPVALAHGLESVKILPPLGENPRELWGSVTIGSVALAEMRDPGRRRVFSLSVGARDELGRGSPSSWSAALDDLASGATDDHRRLICVAAGNVPQERWLGYPEENLTSPLDDPAQSWNALTVGACTHLDRVLDSDFDGWRPIAASGDMSPCNTTSLRWDRTWPLKPDVVLEGGNGVVDPTGRFASVADDLRLLSTNGRPNSTAPFCSAGDTSAAAASAARMAAVIHAEYPDLWPETVRALLVHSARWTATMEKRAPRKGRHVPRERLRCYGFGIPRLAEALWSARDALTLIVQSHLQPFEKDGSKARTRDMHLHALPWPREALEDLGSTPVELRVTLSYFVEPDPSRRGYRGRYRYMSHGLRFDVNTPVENEQAFLLRLNKAARNEDAGLKQTTKSDAMSWALGPNLRSTGSIHSDVWEGPAAELAQRRHVGVYPVIGWWRERPHLGRCDRDARYALVVSIRTPAVSTDIYTPVANQIAVPTEIGF